MHKLFILATKFEENSRISGPISIPPISIKPQKDVAETLKEVLLKDSRILAVSSIEDIQRQLAKSMASALNAHGFKITDQEIKTELLKFGEHSRAEAELTEALNRLLLRYGDKAIHFILNNLSR